MIFEEKMEGLKEQTTMVQEAIQRFITAKEDEKKNKTKIPVEEEKALRDAAKKVMREWTKLTKDKWLVVRPEIDYHKRQRPANHNNQQLNRTMDHKG